MSKTVLILLLAVGSTTNYVSAQEAKSDPIFGAWTGVEYFLARLEDEQGEVPRTFMDTPFGVVSIRIVVSNDSCLFTKSDDAPLECDYDSQKRLLVVPGGVYGADYESGYQLSLLEDGRLKIDSLLKDLVEESAYSYTYIEDSRGLLWRVE